MWIHSVRLKNFKVYENADFRFPEPKDGRNIVLIGAKNGHGKTTFLEALYLCLYDQDAVTHLTRAGLNGSERKYADFLEAALFQKAAKERHGQYEMVLELEIRRHSQGEEYGLWIQRKWHFDAMRKYKAGDNECIVKFGKNGDYKPVGEEIRTRLSNTFAMPVDYAPFFFFDGEKIVEAAKKSGTGEWLSKALKGLSGITLLEELRESLKGYRTQSLPPAGQAKKLQGELEQAQANLRQKQAELETADDELATVREQWRQWDEKRGRLMQQLGGSGNILHSHDLVERRTQLEKDMQSYKERIEAAVKAMPLAFLPRKRLRELQEQLLREQNRLHHEAGKEQIAERVQDFWDAFVSSEKIKEAFGDFRKLIFGEPKLEEAVKDCWEQLFYPLPDNCAKTIEHNYLSLNAHADIQNQIGSLGAAPTAAIGGLLADIDKREREQREVEAEIQSYQDSGKDELVEQLREASAEADKYRGQQGGLENQLDMHKDSIRRYENEISALQNKIADNNPQWLKLQRAQKVEGMIDRLTAVLSAQKTKAVSAAATRINNNIAHGGRIHRIDIDEAAKLHLFAKNGSEITIDFSSGQVQMAVQSLVLALAEVTEYPAPFVIDTPLARLDSGHREGLFRHWSSDRRQVIVLSQDTEITPEVSRRLHAHIGRTYLVETAGVDSGGGRAKVIADAYFE